MELTTLQIAERIAKAAISAWFASESVNRLGPDPPPQAQAHAVLRALRENGVWFCRVQQDAEGVIDGEAPSEVLPEVET